MEGTLTKKVVATYSLSWLIFTSVLQEKAALYALTQAIIKYSTILKDDVDLRILNISNHCKDSTMFPLQMASPLPRISLNAQFSTFKNRMDPSHRLAGFLKKILL